MSTQDSVQSVFNIVNKYVDQIGGGSFSLSCTDLDGINTAAPTVNASVIQSISQPTIGDYDGATFKYASTATLSADPLDASYTNSFVDIASIAINDLSNTLYNGYSLPSSLPTPTLDSPDLNYPEAGFISVKNSAGLSEFDAPDIQVGLPPEFLDIPEITYDLTPLESLSIVLPEIPDLPPVEMLSNPEYLLRDLSPELEEALNKAVDGQVILSPQVQQAILTTEMRRINKDYSRKEREVMRRAAAAGVSLMSGTNTEALIELEWDLTEAEQDVYFKMREEVRERAIKHVQEAIKQQLRLEAGNMALHFQYAAQLVEVLKFNVAQADEYANLLISMFNSNLSAIKKVVASYEAYVDATLAQYRVSAAQLETQRAVLETNTAKVTAYAAQVGTVGVQTDVYTAEARKAAQELEEYSLYVKGLLNNLDIARINIKSFAESNRAYSAAIDVNKAKIEGYAAQVRATGSATDVYEANWQAYAQAQNAAVTASDARRQWYESSVQNLRAELSNFDEASAAQRSYYAALTAWSRANISVSNQYEASVRQLAAAKSSDDSRVVSNADVKLRTAMANADVVSKQDTLQAQADAINASISIGLEAAKATAAAGCAQAANSIRSISAGVSASAGLQSSESYSGTLAKRRSVTNSKSYRKVVSESI